MKTRSPEPENSRLTRLARLLLLGENPKSKTLLAFLGLPILLNALLFLAIIYPGFGKENRFVAQNEFSDKIQDQSWQALYADPRPEILDWSNCHQDVLCPGHILNHSLEAASHREEGHYARVEKMQGQHYWLGQVFSKEKLLDWKSRGANQIIVGYFYATFEVFINGERIMSRDGMTSRLPLVIDLPENPERDLKVSIRVLHNMDEPMPDYLFGGVVTPTQMEKHLREAEFQQLVKPSLAIGFSFALGFLFLLLWITSWRRQEFAAFAAYCLLQASVNALLIPFVWLHLGNFVYHRLNFILMCYSVFSVIFIGITIARIRTWYTTAFMVFMLGVPWLSLLTSWSTNQFYKNSIVVQVEFQTVAYVLAIILVLLQARLVSQKRGELWDPYREHKLYLFVFVFFSLAVVLLLGDTTQWDIRMVYSEIVISILSVTMVQEYHRQVNFISRSPVSKYHQIARGIDDLPCYIISVDLKNSEGLFRLGAESGMGGGFVQKLMFQLSNQATYREAELISSEGDSLIFFLPIKEQAEEVLHSALEINAELYRSMKSFLSMSQLPDSFELRSAIGSGNIRPVWHELGGRKLPGWEQVGSSTVFVDLARMLEAEPKLVERDHSTLIAFPELAEQIHRIAPHLKFSRFVAESKHGRRLELDIATVKNN